jgi:hypothetical protein
VLNCSARLMMMMMKSITYIAHIPCICAFVLLSSFSFFLSFFVSFFTILVIYVVLHILSKVWLNSFLSVTRIFAKQINCSKEKAK